MTNKTILDQQFLLGTQITPPSELTSRSSHLLGNSLQLNNVTKNDRGTYYCVADNGVIPGSRRAISVEVEFKPFIRVGRPRYGQALNYEAVLHCHVEAFPSPTIVWIKDNQQLTNNQHYYISIFSTSDEFTSTTLKVRRIEKKQYGNYTCRATNKLGSTDAEITLFETTNIVCPPACDILQSPFSGTRQPFGSSVVLTVGLLAAIFIHRRLAL